MTTLTEIKLNFNDYRVEQVGSKQMFLVHGFKEGLSLVLSYTTIVGVVQYGKLYLTTTKYSPTTSKQCTQLARCYSTVQRVDDAALQLIIDEA